MANLIVFVSFFVIAELPAEEGEFLWSSQVLNVSFSSVNWVIMKSWVLQQNLVSWVATTIYILWNSLSVLYGEKYELLAIGS